MKTWKKPVIDKITAKELEKYIKVAALSWSWGYDCMYLDLR